MNDFAGGSDVTIGELTRWMNRQAEEVGAMRRELADGLAGIRSELIAASSALVSKDRYDAEQRRQDERIAALEIAERERQLATRTRWQAAATSFVAPILVALIVGWLAAQGFGL